MVISMPPGSVIAVAITAICLFYGTLSTPLMKKETLRKLFKISSCQAEITPYNAPPLTRNNGTQAAGSAGFRPEPHGEKRK
ncbi:hypothetical protein DUB99_21790 [Salmonella enterica subsp. enterica serovar Bonariensis]|nr:hypothetical protein [Salmonella enterica subsp. enterica serovar Bonariensis]EAU3454322.1 hypothetical protein [Salmonella enterica]EAB9993821.1 hypothetical protein [Salmonella enterica subsp. enterica serovar Bonariensis]EBM3943199.1 hypothetical protein [Salmonella enterica]EBV0045152.1 hypothetical protein [Salmonella enterica subsp. enterica serovar Bonariensis]